jgi:hypothetical protein
MTTVNYYINYLVAGIEVLENYLQAKALFWPLGIPSPAGERPYPRLTLGNLLLFRFLANAYRLESNHKDRLVWIEENMHLCYEKRKVAWTRKAAKEYSSRLRQWKYYVNELFDNPKNAIDYYVSEVRLRLLLDLLEPELDKSKTDLPLRLVELDSLLMGVLDPTEFILDNELLPGFNQERFWYLWGKPALNKFTSI